MSTITPTYAYNTVNHPIIPTRGLRVNASLGFTGSILGGNVNMVQPAFDVAYFRRGIFKTNVMGFHMNARFISGFGGKVAPPYSRYYMGGEDDIRGFNILTISPIAYIPTDTQIQVSEQRRHCQSSEGLELGWYRSRTVGVTQTIPTYQLHPARRRYGSRVQLRVPDSDRRSRDARSVHRCRRGSPYLREPTWSEYRSR